MPNGKKGHAQAPKSKPNKKKKSGRGKAGSNAILQGMSSRVRLTTEPAAIDVVTTNPSMFKVGVAAAHKDFGSVGSIRITGRQYLCALTTAASSPDIFGSGTATTTANYIQLSPDILNGRAALMARTYARYAFRRLRVVYISESASTVSGSFCYAYNCDAETGFATNSFANTQNTDPCVVTPYRKSAVLNMTYTGDLTWFSEIDSATSAGTRQCKQGVIFAYGSGNYGSAATLGQFYVEYVLDLYQPVTDLGFSVSVNSSQEQDLVNSYLNRLRLGDRGDIASVSSFGSRRT